MSIPYLSNLQGLSPQASCCWRYAPTDRILPKSIAVQSKMITMKSIYSFFVDADFRSFGICSRSRKQRILTRAIGKPNAPAIHHKGRLRCFLFANAPMMAPRPTDKKINVRSGTNINMSTLMAPRCFRYQLLPSFIPALISPVWRPWTGRGSPLPGILGDLPRPSRPLREEAAGS